MIEEGCQFRNFLVAAVFVLALHPPWSYFGFFLSKCRLDGASMCSSHVHFLNRGANQLFGVFQELREFR
jgi:hypothetical protein